MHFKGFCLLRFDIQNITIKPSAGGCLFDAALTALKTLISQPSLHLPPPPLYCRVGSVAAVPGTGAGAAVQRHPPAELLRPPAGQDGKELGRKRCGNGVCVSGSGVRVLIAAGGFGGSRLLPFPAALSCGKGAGGPAGHPGGSFQRAALGSVALSLVPPPALPLLDGDSASGALPSVAGEAPTQRLGPMGGWLCPHGVPRGRGCCHWGGRQFQGGWFWGDLALGGAHQAHSCLCWA